MTKVIVQMHEFRKDYRERLASDRDLGIANICVKTHDGVSFPRGWGDVAPAIGSAAEWAPLVATYLANNVRATPWCVPKGVDITREAKIAADISHLTNSIVLDVEYAENHTDFWLGGQAAIAPYLEQLHLMAPNARIILQYDSRWPGNIWLDEWLKAGVDELLGMDYWTDFQLPAEQVLATAERNLSSHGLPWSFAVPGDSVSYPDLSMYEQVYIWRRGNMTAGAIALAGSSSEVIWTPELEPELPNNDKKLQDLYDEEVRQALITRDLTDRVANLEQLLAKLKEVLS